MKLTYGDTVSAAMDGHVAVVTIDAPPHNFVSLEMIASLADAFEDLGANHDCRAIVLATTGSSFCAGAQLGEVDRFGAELVGERRRLFAAAAIDENFIQAEAARDHFALHLRLDAGSDNSESP